MTSSSSSRSLALTPLFGRLLGNRMQDQLEFAPGRRHGVFDGLEDVRRRELIHRDRQRRSWSRRGSVSSSLQPASGLTQIVSSIFSLTSGRLGGFGSS